jgi:type I restriction-modification system DNA methylase subunit
LPRKQIQNHSWNHCHHLSHLLEAVEVVVNHPFLPDKSNNKDIIKTLLQHPLHVLIKLWGSFKKCNISVY